MQIKKYEPAKDMIKDTLKIYQDYQDQNNDVKLSIASLQIQLSDCYKEIGEPEGGIILL